MWTINYQQLNDAQKLANFEQHYPQLNFARYSDPLVSHAFVLHGQEPANVLLYAEHLARRLLCDQNDPSLQPCSNCEGCHAFEMGNPQRYLELFPQGTSISIAQVREMVNQLCSKLEARKKQIIMLYFPAQMAKEAANAILKTLEEPPDGRVFILVNPYQRALLATIQSRVLSINIPSAETQFKNLDELDKAMARLSDWNLQGDPTQQRHLLGKSFNLSGYLRKWLEEFQEENWSSQKILQDQLVNPQIHISRKLAVLNFLDELAGDEFNHLEHEIYHLERVMTDWSDWIEGEGSRVFRNLRQTLGDSYHDRYLGEASKANLQRFYRGFCIREIELIFTEILVMFEWLLINDESGAVLPQEKQICLNYENLRYGHHLYELSHRLVELRGMLYNNQPWSNLLEQLGMTLIKLK